MYTLQAPGTPGKCSVLQCVAVCCSVLQCVAVIYVCCRSIDGCSPGPRDTWKSQRVAVYCSMLRPMSYAKETYIICKRDMYNMSKRALQTVTKKETYTTCYLIFKRDQCHA